MKRIICIGIIGLLVALVVIIKRKRDKAKGNPDADCGCHKPFDEVAKEKEKDMESFAQGTSLIAGSTLLLVMVLVGGLIALVIYMAGNVGKAVATDTDGTLNKVDRGLDTAQKAKNVVYR